MSVIVSTCCGAALRREPEVLRKGVAETCWNVCSACHQPNDGETIPQRDARIAESVRERCAKVCDEYALRKDFDPDDPSYSTGKEQGGEDCAENIRELDLSDAGKDHGRKRTEGENGP